MDHQDVVGRVDTLVGAGRHTEAALALAGFDARGVRDADAHLALARAAERSGDLRRAVLEYNLALRDDPDQPEVLRRLARLRIDQGEDARAERALRRLLELRPSDEEAAHELVDLLLAVGRGEVAQALIDTLRDQGHDAWSGSDPAAARADADADDEDRGEPIRDADALAFADLFAGREGVHARQWQSGAGQHGYTPVREPFTAAVARNHLAGAYTVGIYPVRQDNTVLFAAFDLDIARFALSRHAGGRDAGALAPLLRRVQTAARRFADAAAHRGLCAYVEDSGWKGRHVWIFFHEPITAGAARRLMALIAVDVGELPEEMSVEVFPKQSRVASDGLGNLIKLPLGIHRVTGRRCPLLDVDGRPLRRPLEVLRTAQRARKSEIRAILADASVAPQTDDSPPSADRIAPEPDLDDPEPTPPETAPIVPERAPYALDHDPDYQWLLRGCAVLREIAGQADSRGILDRQAQHVVVYTVGHLANGARAVNALLGGLLNVERGILLKSPLRGHPMSCPKIRARAPAIASGVDCNCHFPRDAGLYPTPVLHLQSLRARGVLGVEPGQLSTLQIERLVAELARARRERWHSEKRVRELEARLRAVMVEQALDRLETPDGTLELDAAGELTLRSGAGGLEQRGEDDGPLRDGAGGPGRRDPGAAGGPEGQPPA